MEQQDPTEFVPPAAHWSLDSAQTIDIDDVRELKVAIVGGRLDVITHDEPVTRVEVAQISGTNLEIGLRNGVLHVEHRDQNPLGWLKRLSSMTNQRIIVSIAVPAGTPVRASTVNGEGLISGIQADSELSTVSGSIIADGTRGDLEVDTVSGEIIVRGHSGRFGAKSVSGEITASGELMGVRAKTVSGDLGFDFHGSPDVLDLTSVSGDVTVRVPAAVGAALDLKTVSGRVILDDQKFTGTGQKVRTSSGPAQPQLRISGNSVSGDISVVHAIPAESEGTGA
ncbi:MAG: DUF4097 family beta strand repeat-containing protein [Renibacterium salmoninarum]|jgi:DUF4097 and DUF4098 domain-containing protein YvlB|nr:DUF4097 family beta strand repeat-containing protein [Renibacterium salmoninarum]